MPPPPSSMKRFADVVSSVYKDGDHVWVHDYQLMQVPYELRKMHPNCRVAWFLHTPFPSSEVYRILPVRKQLLQVKNNLLSRFDDKGRRSYPKVQAS